MKQVYIIHEHHPALLLFFAGWAADETPFKQYHPQNLDYMVCYDYRKEDFDYSIFDQYTTINVVAWSMGVWEASRILNATQHPQLFSIAFNGTNYPIDNINGIPIHIFEGTLRELTPTTLQRFLRRMCGNSLAYRSFMNITPHRDFDEIKQELQCIKERYCQRTGIQWDELGIVTQQADEDKLKCYAQMYGGQWDYAYIGREDHIIPASNQLNAFNKLPEKRINLLECAHYDEEVFRFLLQDRWNSASGKQNLSHTKKMEND